MITIKAFGLCERPTPVSRFRLAGSLWDAENLKHASLHIPTGRMPQCLLLQGQKWGMCSPERSPIHMLTDMAWRTHAEIDKNAGPSRMAANASLKLMSSGRGWLSRTRNGGKGFTNPGEPGHGHNQCRTTLPQHEYHWTDSLFFGALDHAWCC